MPKVCALPIGRAQEDVVELPAISYHPKEATMRFPRGSGVLLHPTSFPSRFGIGDLGDGAHRFVDWVAQSGQSLWQVMPLGPTGYGDSPYQCFSAFAGNPLLISPEQLVATATWPRRIWPPRRPFPTTAWTMAR